MNPSLIIPVLFVIILIYASISRSKFRQKQNAVIAKLKVQNKDESIYFCNGFDDLGDGHYQFYGEVGNKDIKPGMKITLPTLGEFDIKEVYANDGTPDKPNEILTKNSTNTAIVIEAVKLDTKPLAEKLKHDLVLALKIS